MVEVTMVRAAAAKSKKRRREDQIKTAPSSSSSLPTVVPKHPKPQEGHEFVSFTLPPGSIGVSIIESVDKRRPVVSAVRKSPCLFRKNDVIVSVNGIEMETISGGVKMWGRFFQGTNEQVRKVVVMRKCTSARTSRVAAADVQSWFLEHNLPWNESIQTKLAADGMKCVDQLKGLDVEEFDEYFKEEATNTQCLAAVVFQRLKHREPNELQQRKDKATTTSTSTATKNKNKVEGESVDRPKKRQKCDIVTDAAKILAPRFAYKFANIEDQTWIEPSSSMKEETGRTMQRDAKTLQAMLYAISRGNPDRAGKVVARLLNMEANKQLKKDVLDEFKDEEEDVNTRTHRLIVKGIKDSVAHHTKGRGGTRTKAAEAFVKNVALASVFGIVKDNKIISESQLSKCTGTSRRTIGHALALARELIDSGEQIATLVPKRQVRKDFVRDKVAPYLYDFLMDDAYTMLDESSKKTVEVEDPRTGETVNVRRRAFWEANKKKRHLQFQGSEHYARFQADHDGATVGYYVFYEVAAKFEALCPRGENMPMGFKAGTRKKGNVAGVAADDDGDDDGEVMESAGRTCSNDAASDDDGGDVDGIEPYNVGHWP